jgi:hypothetical protein
MSFNTIQYLLFLKNKPELDSDLLESFVPFLTTKTFSFYNNDYVDYINESLNVYGYIFDSKENQFKFFDNIIPKLKRKKIDYIKKTKKEKEKDPIPVPEFYSKREIDMIESLCKYLHD